MFFQCGPSHQHSDVIKWTLFFQDCIFGKTRSAANCPPWPNICCLPGEGILDRKVMLHWASTILTPEPLSTASELSYYFLKYDNSEKTALTAVIHLAWLCLVLAVVLHLFPALCVESASERERESCFAVLFHMNGRSALAADYIY